MSQVSYIDNPLVIEELDDVIPPMGADTGNAELLEVGGAHACAVGVSGNMKCWGNGSSGQLGLGNTQNVGDDSSEQGEGLPFVNLGTGLTITSLALGDSHSCALFSNGSIKCWGNAPLLGLGLSSSSDGYGDGYLETGDVLVFIELPSATTATMIEVGSRHTCAVLSDNSLICWGRNDMGQLGLGDTDDRGDASNEVGDNFAAVSLPTSRTVSQLALGNDHTCAIWDDGSVSCWGSNANGQLGIGSMDGIGDGSSEMGDNLAFVSLPGGNAALNITAGDGFTCVILDTTPTETYCWGINDYGQLGIENTNTIGDGGSEMGDNMVETDLGTSRSAVEIDAGMEHICAILDNDYVKCWGSGTNGRLGYGNQNHRGTSSGSSNGMGDNLPYVNLGSSASTVNSYDVDRIEVGSGSTCVIMNNDDVRCWGENSLGQLGYGDTENRGDGASDLPHYTEVDLELDETPASDSCMDSFEQAHHSSMDTRLDSSSSDVGDKNDFGIMPNGCPAIVYVDDDNNKIRFSAFSNGLWGTESPLSGGTVIDDIDFIIDDSYSPHIVHSLSSGTDQLTYTTKTNGFWESVALTATATQVEIEIDSSGDILIGYIDSNDLKTISCSSACSTSSSWSASDTHSVGAAVVNLDSVIDSSDTLHFAIIKESGSADDLLHVSRTSGGTYASTTIDGSASASSSNASVAIAIGYDSSLHIAYANVTAVPLYAWCDSSCDTLSSWSTEATTGLIGGELDIAISPEGEPWILAQGASVDLAVSNRNSGTWETQTVSNAPGTPQWTSLLIGQTGRVWASVHPSSADLWVLNDIDYAGSGLQQDADGDGWTGLDEVRCQTDALDSTSTPADFDDDGICDRFDTKNDLPSVGESNVITTGDDFGCAILDDRSVSCWGKNDADQLGNSVTGASSNEAVSVDLPTSFEASDIDAGSSHACAVGIDGSVVCWGANDKGQLGIGTTSASEAPSIVSLPSGVVALSVSAGSDHTCVAISSGSVYCWGEGGDSQTGNYYVSSPGYYQEDGFESGDLSTLEWVNDDSTYPWSIDSGSSSTGSNSISVQVNSANQQSDIELSIPTAAGNITFDYKTSTATNHYLRFYIDDVLQDSWSGIAASTFQSVSFDFDAGLHTFKWSSVRSSSAGGQNKVYLDDIRINSSTELISGGTVGSPSEAVLPASVGVIEDVATGDRHSCALNTIGDVYCWGYNGGSSNMVLGNASTTSTNSSAPVKVDLSATGSHYSSDWDGRAFSGISAGADATCAILSSSLETACWGQGYDDKILGNSTSSIKGTRVDAGSSGDKHYSVSVGTEHACIVVASAIECWGTEVSGELGDGGGASFMTATPVAVSIPAGHIPLEVAVSESSTTSCALFKTSDDTRKVMCWGEGGDGRMGYGSTTDLNAPAADSAVESSGTDILTPDSSSSVSRLLSRPVEIGGGTNFYCVRSIQGLVKCWGQGNFGQLGIGNTTTIGDGANEMGENLAFVNLGDNKTAVQISVGIYHACAVLNDASVKCWGRNQEYQLGTGNTTQIGITTATLGDQMPAVNLGGNAVKVAAGQYHTCALLDTGEVKCWGKGDQGIQGDGSAGTNTVPTTVLLGDYKAVDITASLGHSCAILENGAAKCWGDNSQYQLGLGNATDMGDSTAHSDNKMSFLNMADGRTPVKISAGQAYSCVLQDNGNIACWGVGSYGRLGYGSGSSVSTPAASNVDIGTGRTALDVQTSASGWFSSSGYYSNPGSYIHTCAIGDDELLRCWGGNNNGQLGIGSTTQIGDGANEMGDNLMVTDIGDHVESVALGSLSSCAIREDGQVRCWGNNGNGQLGHGDTTRRGDQAGEMGDDLPATELWLKADDTDSDGTIDLWDTDDDDDGTIDVDDDFPLDECADIDTDGDGMPNDIVNSCSTTLIEDLDDDDDNWNDTDEVACATNPLLDTDTPSDYDSDLTCDYLDTDDDNDTFSDIVEGQCEPMYGYSSFNAMSSTSASHYMRPDYGSAIWFDDEYGLRVIAPDGASNGYARVWTYQNAVPDSSADYMRYGGTYGSSSVVGVGTNYRYPQVTNHGGLDYLTLSRFTYEMDAQLSTQWSQRQLETTGWPIYATDVAFSPNGTYYATDNSELDYYDTITDQTGTLSYPTGVQSQYTQIAIDDTGIIHLVALESGSYTYWKYDSGAWSSGETLWSGSNEPYYKEAQLRVNSTGVPYFTFLDAGFIRMFSRSGSWNEVWSSGIPDNNNKGMEMKIAGDDNPHIIWNDFTNATLYHTYMDGSSMRTELVREETYWSPSYAYGLSMAFDEQGDVFIFSSNSISAAGAEIHYKGYFDDPSKDASVTPPDADGDGTCDVLDTASLDYPNLVWENGSSNTISPIYTGLWPDSVSITPALPVGVQFDSSTGVISGTFTQADVNGTTYTISTTSSGDPWQKVFTLRVQERIPLLTGFEYGPWGTSPYSYGSNGIKSNKIAFAPDGSMYVFGVATGSETFSSLSTPSPSMQNGDDAYLAKRNGTTGDWEWVEVFDTCGIYAQDIQISDTGSVFLLAYFRSDVSSSGCTFDFRNSDSFDFTSNNYYDTVVIKYDSSGTPQWVSNSNATATNSNGAVYSSNIEIDSNGNVTIGGSVHNSSAPIMDFAGVDFTDLDGLGYQVPYLARLNPDGTGAWVASPRSNDSSNGHIQDYEVEITSHPDGSATLTFVGRYALLFGNQELFRSPSGNYQSVVAHLDAGGSWVWVQNVSTSLGQVLATPTISSFSDGSMLVAFSDGYSSNSIGTLNLMGDESIEPAGDAWFAAVALDNSGNKLWTYFEDDFGMRDGGSDSRMFSVTDSDDVVHLMMDTEDSSNAQYFRTIAFDIDGNVVYQTQTYAGSSTNYLYDFGLDSYGSLYFVAEANSQYWGGYTTTTEYQSSSWQSMGSTYARIFRTFSTGILESHEIENNYPIAGQYNDFYPINKDVLSYAVSWTISPALPTGLIFHASTGRIYGTPSVNSSNVTYTINVTLSNVVLELRKSHSFQLTFPISDPAPDVTYDAGDLSPVLERGTPMVAISPTAGLDDQYLSYFTTDPALPSGLSIDSATGDISGTPNVNLTSTDFTVKACNSWGVCDEHTLTLLINEPVAVISYNQAHISLKKEEPMTPLEPSNSGGVVETWEIDPSLPVGMEIDEFGVISGIPVANQDNTTYKIFANNSGGSVNTTMVIQINGTGMYIFYPYAEHRIAVNSPINTIYPSQRGAAAITWEITPDLPVGMEFGEGNGSIWGTPTELSVETVYSVSAQGFEPDISSATTIIITVLVDIDGDGLPDESDDDDDGDGWTDEEEVACGGTNTTDADDHPFDSDGDGICDVNDDINDSPILLFYESSTLELSLNLEMVMFDATTVGGDVTSWDIDPYLPFGLTFSGTSPARDGGDNGSIFGIPTELSSVQAYTITASNNKYSSTFILNLAVLLDTDLDGIPDRDDSDDDADGWSDQIEWLCGKDPLDGSETPVDTDGDQLCDYIDDDDDDDGFIDTYEQQCGSDWKDADEVPIDADGSGVCDGLETDTDGDGWLDGIEFSCGTNSTDNTSIPTDIDNDFICDSLDDDMDNDGYDNHQDDFPEDKAEWLDTDSDGVGDNADTDDDNDSWTDMWEELCGTDSKSNTSVPDDFDSDMICDLFDDDIDNDGVSNDMDAFEKDANETYDFDADGIGDNADDDDDDDQWLDVDEIACGTDPMNATSTPENVETCNATKKSEDAVESSSFVTKYWWLCVIFLLLLLLLIPLLIVVRERSDSVLVMMGMQKGPQPEHTFSSPDFISGSGTKKDPYLLQDIQGLAWGKSASSKESITISHLAPDTIVRFMDMNTEENEGRFDMADILVEEDDDDWTSDSDDEESGTTSITFKLKFKDSPESHDGDEYCTLIRVGNSTVYFQWTVSIKEPSGGKRRQVSKKLDPIIEKAKSEDSADKKAEAEVKQKAEAEARIKKAEEEARQKAEAEVKQKAEAEARIKKAEAEARQKAEAEVKQKAEAEAKAKTEQESRIKAVEDEVRQNAESEAATKLAAMEAMIAEKMTALEDKMEGLSKKEAELARVAAKSEFIDFSTIGTATASEKDDLQRTKGIGPFLEEKLNALGIFTFKQIASMTPEIEDQVNVAIEFFRGRVKRDKWVVQAKEFLKED